uniref:hypothetical protein n=1 Tax=uncultured Veillonella sp. TaxID=159268 RepID=UPI0025EFA575
YVIYRNAETDSISRKQSLEQKKESVMEVINNPDTGIGIMADTVSYMTDYKGLEYGGTAVTFGQAVPKFLDNNSRFESIEGKYLAGVSDFGSEAIKARLSLSAANLLATAYAGKQVMSPYANNLSIGQGVFFAISGGLIVNQTISPTINITNEEIKNKIKDIENEWKK